MLVEGHILSLFSAILSIPPATTSCGLNHWGTPYPAFIKPCKGRMCTPHAHWLQEKTCGHPAFVNLFCSPWGERLPRTPCLACIFIKGHPKSNLAFGGVPPVKRGRNLGAAPVGPSATGAVICGDTLIEPLYWGVPPVIKFFTHRTKQRRREKGQPKYDLCR